MVKRVFRKTKVSKEEAARLNKIRKDIDEELPDLVERHHKRQERKLIKRPLLTDSAISTFWRGLLKDWPDVRYETIEDIAKKVAEGTHSDTCVFSVLLVRSLDDLIEQHPALQRQYPDAARSLGIDVRNG